MMIALPSSDRPSRRVAPHQPADDRRPDDRGHTSSGASTAARVIASARVMKMKQNIDTAPTRNIRPRSNWPGVVQANGVVAAPIRPAPANCQTISGSQCVRLSLRVADLAEREHRRAEQREQRRPREHRRRRPQRDDARRRSRPPPRSSGTARPSRRAAAPTARRRSAAPPYRRSSRRRAAGSASRDRMRTCRPPWRGCDAACSGHWPKSNRSTRSEAIIGASTMPAPIERSIINWPTP